MCKGHVMNSGKNCADITIVNTPGGTTDFHIGVCRPSADVKQVLAWREDWFWGLNMDEDGALYHEGLESRWPGMEVVEQGDTMRLLLDSDAGTLAVKKNGRLLGTPVTSGLTGDLCWAVCCYYLAGYPSASRPWIRRTFERATLLRVHVNVIVRFAIKTLHYSLCSGVTLPLSSLSPLHQTITCPQTLPVSASPL